MADFGISIRGAFPHQHSLAEIAELSRELGAASLLAPSVFELSPELQPRELAAAAEIAHGSGLGLAVGLHFIHPFRVHDDPGLLAAGSGNAFLGLQRALERVSVFDDTDIQFALGDPADRTNPIVGWNDQIDALCRLLDRLRPTLQSLCLRLCLKTHEEITTYEIARLVERVGDDIVSVGFDPVNSLLLMEPPMAALERIGRVLQHVYFDDATFSRARRTYHRWLCDVGRGVLDWPQIRRSITRLAPNARWWIDLHKGQFDIVPFSSQSLEKLPDLTVTEQAAILKMAMSAAASEAGGEGLQGLVESQSKPWLRLEGATTALGHLLGPEPT